MIVNGSSQMSTTVSTNRNTLDSHDVVDNMNRVRFFILFYILHLFGFIFSPKHIDTIKAQDLI